MKTLVTEPINEQGVEMLKKVGEVVFGSCTDEDTIIREGKDVEAILIRSAKITPNIIEKTPNLKIVAKHGIGVDNISVDYCTKKGILVVNAPESNANAVAEHTVALILASTKNIVFLDTCTRSGQFSKRNTYPTMELKDKTIGFIGMGNIATLVAKKLSGFDVEAIAFDVYKKDSKYAKMVSNVDDIYKNADIISLHVPLTSSTKHMISDRQFGMMKKNAIIINASRGSIIDEDALYSALKNKRICAAACDVFEEEPPAKNNPLFELKNFIASPHNAALSKQALVNMSTHAAAGICDFAQGRVPKWIVNRNCVNISK